MAAVRRTQTPPLYQFSSVEEYVEKRQGNRVIKKVLIANNGIAAVKCIRSVRTWAYQTFGDDHAIQFVAMATPEDLHANAEYIRMADQFEEVAGGSNNNNYANVSLIVDIAERNGCDAVWAGWGHASENPQLPTALLKSGITFIGPGAHAMKELGDKINSTILAQSVNVSVVPWSGSGIVVDYEKEGRIPQEAVDKSMVKNIQEVREAVKHIGYPLMIKASEGGGGKGIRKVTSEEELEASFKSVQGEVPGSPIFLMKLVPNCHHLEVQVIGDIHGNAISIYGRDCSVQRRHQKIIEEGPAIAADPTVWEKMEQAAVRLAAAVGYVGAGTVEYLYANGEYYFLELNPRLQVEHPVSEQISGVNLPATQLNIAMGIPLYNIPAIRRMYGREPFGLDVIDFKTAKQEPPNGHVIACRITAENPDNGFKPTSGSIQELTFRSTPNVWGYFSIQGLGGLHEFADSQFGHLFAWGNERDESRKNMVIALKELSIRGDIRTPVEYLVTLLETDDFRDLSIHTGWLDERIANPQLNIDESHGKPSPFIPVLCGAAWKAFHESKQRHNVYMSFIERGQIPPNELIHCTDEIELIYDDVKYLFEVCQFGQTKFFLTINGSEAEIEVIEFSDGGLLVVVDGQSLSVYGKEETEGLRLSIRGKSHLFAREYDPSNLRSTSAGKIIRYLVKDGSQVKAGTPYVEIEVMKMFMIQKCPEAGRIHFELAVGTSLHGGETIARLELENPNAIKRARKFTEKLPSLKPPKPEKNKLHQRLRNVISHLENVLAGFPSNSLAQNVKDMIKIVNDPMLPLLEFSEILSILAGRLPPEVDSQIGKLMKSYELVAVSVELDESVGAKIKFPAAAVLKVLDVYAESLKATSPEDEAAFRNVASPVETLAKRYDRGYLNDVVMGILKRYLFVESLFQHKQRDEVAAELRQQFKDDPEEIFRISLSRNAQSQSGELILLLLNSVVENQIEEFVSILHEFATLTGKNCLEISVKARQLLIRYQLPSFKQRQVAIEECLRSALQITTPAGRLERISTLVDQSTSLFDVLVTFFWHENPQVRDLAVEVYVRRSYSAYYIDRVVGFSDNDLFRVEWEFISPDRAPTPPGGSNNSSAGAIGSPSPSLQSPGANPFQQKNPFHVESADSLLTTEQGIDITRYGLMLVFNKIENFFDQFQEILKMFAPPHSHIGQEPINVLNIAIPAKSEGQLEQVFICNVAKFLYDHREQLREVGMRRITILVCKEFKFPKYYTFRERLNYQEDSVNRHVEPPLAYHLELSRLSNFDITYIPTLNRQIHLFYATAKGKRPTDPDFASCFFVRAMVRSGSDAVPQGIVTSSKDYLISQAERVMVDAIKSLEVAVREKRFAGAQNHHIFLKVITEVAYEPESVDVILRTLGETYGRRLWKLRVGKLELSGKVRRGNSVTSLRFTVINPTGYDFLVDGYLEVKDNKTNTTFLSSITGPGAPQDQHPVNEPYPLPSRIERKRFLAQNHGTTYCYDFPSLYKAAVRKSWEIYQDQIRTTRQQHQQANQTNIQIPSKFMECRELILNDDDKLVEADPSREPGQNTVGMVVWKVRLYTPEAPQGRDVVLIANDITLQIGSFGPKEDALFDKASKYARKHGLPRIYISCNSGARIGLASEVKERFRVRWKNLDEPQKGFDYLYLEDQDYQALEGTNSVRCAGEDHRIVDIIGQQDGLGVENLRGSGLIAGETSLAYEEIFTITQVTGRSVGIGAYLVRLGQRTVQTEAPIILTGASAINKLLGKEVYSSNEQLGGIQIMFRNGVSHLDVLDDFRGTLAIVQWLSFVPVRKGTLPPVLDYHDPVDREIEFQPTSTPYNPVHMLSGYTDSHTGSWVSGFFDQGTWMETLAGWARTVICGRARLGGIPVGVIAVETRTVENVVPADPANPESQEQVFMQAGQVWFPDSAYKTAQAISDFNYGEELPLIIFANWRGFSGGMRDMYNEILKFGSYIVDNLRKYRHPVFIYIPPNGELRGGAWVVLDPTINSRHIEMYCDERGRGGVLEPNGTVEIKYRSRDLIQTMHRLDVVLRELDAQLSAEANEEKHSQLRDRIHSREQELLQIYQQVAIQFADLHDTPGRMKAKGVIRDVVEWKSARKYFYYRLKRVLKEESIREQLLAAQPDLDYDQVTNVLLKAVPADVYASDQMFLSWAENPDQVSDAVKLLREQHIRSQLLALYQLDPKIVEATLKDLQKK